MTREHRKTAILAAIAAALVIIDILPLRTVTIGVDLAPAGQPVAEKASAADAGSATALAIGALSLVMLVVTICMIIWVVRRCLRHIADAKRPNPADVF